jgi:hypothetical protein
MSAIVPCPGVGALASCRDLFSSSDGEAELHEEGAGLGERKESEVLVLEVKVWQ